MASSLTSHPQSASYQSSGFAHRMGWGARPTLLLVDVCQAYWTAVKYGPGLAMADASLFWAKFKSLRVFNGQLDDRGLGGWVGDDLRPVEGGGEVAVKKKYASAFFGTALASDLRVVGAACGDMCEEIQNANLFDLDAKYADVVSEEEAIEHLREGWPKV
ncbi:hypothetical protein PG999_004071 [Apiospora kogelbergensis]|uniref:Uncharacterized protein n=1 Tax=Apiospora kogelbergensis TaxID=1337665 RepID=A0AAW0R586_9PEZI